MATPCKRLKPKNRSEWLALRKTVGLGASEAAAVVGMSPWMTASELFEIKTGIRQAPDLSGNAEVSRGVRLEKPLRELYKADHPDYKVRYNQFDMLFQKDRPFIFATLDGEVIDDEGRRGLLELKTSSPNGKAGWDKWRNRVPDHYACQIWHQLSASGFEFADLVAALYDRENDKTIRTYHFERSECEADIEYLVEKETEFWNSIQNRSVPPMTIVF